MADTSLFKRLGRLFSSDVVIRNVGGDQLKVADVNQIQTTGRYQTNSLIDRFSRLYIYNNKNIFNPNLNYQTLRIQLYSDYEAMDTDPIIAAALDIISDEATLKNDQGEILSIKSSDENIQRVLYNLYYDVLNIEFNLSMIAALLLIAGYSINDTIVLFDRLRTITSDEDNKDSFSDNVNKSIKLKQWYKPNINLIEKKYDENLKWRKTNTWFISRKS